MLKKKRHPFKMFSFLPSTYFQPASTSNLSAVLQQLDGLRRSGSAVMAIMRLRRGCYLRFCLACLRVGLIFGRHARFVRRFEGSRVLNGNLSNVKYIADCGVKIVTLTWNGASDVGDGSGVEEGKGLTNFGKKLVKEF